ncbi:MAG: response regulator [Blastocatellia bacterium]|nr:response regulator [Blastocatellia bacterium]
MNEKPKVLVVDDQPFIVAIFAELFRSEEVSVLSASNGEEGLELACKQIPNMIFLDIEMPRMDGISVCKKLRQDSRFDLTPIYMLSARGETPSDEEQDELKITGYLTKPFSPLQVYNLIRGHLKLPEE